DGEGGDGGDPLEGLLADLEPEQVDDALILGGRIVAALGLLLGPGLKLLLELADPLFPSLEIVLEVGDALLALANHVDELGLLVAHQGAFARDCHDPTTMQAGLRDAAAFRCREAPE